MTLQQLLTNDTPLSEEILDELKKVDSFILESFRYQNEYVIKNTCKHFCREIATQNITAQSSNKKTLGYEFLEKQLISRAPEDAINMRFIESSSWGGRAYFSGDGDLLGVFLGKKEHKSYKTPTNWDGSIESLKKFNEE